MIHLTEDRFLRSADIKTYFSISNTTLHRWLKAGKLPQPEYVNSRMIWRQSAIEAAEARMLAMGNTTHE